MSAALGTKEWVDYAAAGLGALMTGIVTYRAIRPYRILAPSWAIAVITGLITFLALFKNGSIVLIAYLFLALAVPVALLIGIARRYGLLHWGGTERSSVQAAASDESRLDGGSPEPRAVGSQSEDRLLRPAQRPTATAKTKSPPGSGKIIPMAPFKTELDQPKRPSGKQTKHSH